MTNNKHPKHTNQVRTIGEQCRGRKLTFLSVDGLRPAPDSMHGKLFNWLGQDLAGKAVLDLFNDSGTLGMEAASRHAAEAVTVGSHRQTVRILQRNVRGLGLRQMEIVYSDGMAYLTRPSERFGVAFLDPPFAWEDWQNLFIQLQNHLRDGVMVYIEAGKVPEKLDWLEVRRKGKVGMSKLELLLYS